jgi:glutamate synthase (NADPH/NADH) small chain
MASSLGRICYHYCEAACVIGKKGDPVAIRHLKRAAQDYANIEGTYLPEEPNGMSVAVVGAGPAGLMAAWVLAGKGYAVTVYEEDDKVGGLITQTIPEYRLPRDAWEDDVNRMKELGIRFEFGVRLGGDITLDALRDEHDAVFIGIGTHMPYRLRVPGEELEGVHHALEFLKRVVGRGEDVKIGKKVAVIGGGDVAMDSARTARRLKSDEVTVVYRRSRQEMPADDQEIQEAEDEGIVFKFLTAPVRVLGEDRVEGMECLQMELGEPDESGRRRPVPIEGSNFVIDVDTVLIAIGQTADLEGLPEGIGIEKGKGGIIVSQDENGATEVPGVYVGGGVSVVHAMAAGKKAAHAIDEYLRRAG